MNHNCYNHICNYYEILFHNIYWTISWMFSKAKLGKEKIQHFVQTSLSHFWKNVLYKLYWTAIPFKSSWQQESLMFRKIATKLHVLNIYRGQWWLALFFSKFTKVKIKVYDQLKPHIKQLLFYWKLFWQMCVKMCVKHNLLL